MAKKDIKFLVSKLDEFQKEALRTILEKLQNNKTLKQADVGLLGYSFSRARHNETAEFYHIGVRQLYKWVDGGCPRNEDDTYDLYKVHCWLLEKDHVKNDDLDLKEKKLEQEIEKLKITNARLAEKYIDRNEHENILTSRAVSLRNHFEKGLSLNRHARSMRSVEELAALDYEFVKEMMEAYIGKGE